MACLHLTLFLKDNGLLRISDILRWTPVSVKAGSNRQMLSFQRGYLPLLRVGSTLLIMGFVDVQKFSNFTKYLSSEFVVKSTLSHLVK
jgi:hypothetical protein